MRRLLVCYNPRSSHHAAIADEVLAVVRSLPGWMVGRYEVRPTTFEDNVKNIVQLLNDGDLVVAAGGDGTAAIVINSIMQSNKDVALGALGYGNFNDIATMLGRVHGRLGVMDIIQKFSGDEVGQIFPLEIKINGKHWRYAPSYMTIGMFAESTEVFESEKVRKKLRTGRKSRVFSILQLAKWYFGKGKRSRLPGGSLNGMAWAKGTTDYIALNGATMAAVMKGGNYYLRPEGFISGTARLGNFFRLAKFMLTSMAERVPGEVSKKDVLEFTKPSEVELHAEGEYEKMSGVLKIEVGKTGKGVKVVILGDR